MGVVQERRGNEAELARAWVQGRERVLRATKRSFPTAGSAMVEAAVDQAWVELYERGHAGPPERLLSQWKGRAYLRALNGVRERRRHPMSPIAVEELAETHEAGEGDGFVGVEELRAQARAQEIVHQVSGDARRWVEAVLDDPSAPPRDLARTLGWDREKLKTVARRTRARLRVFVHARTSGAICARRQAVMAAFAATQLAQRDPDRAERLGEHAILSAGLYEQVALHIAGCEECERAWRRAQGRLLRPRLVLFPATLASKLAAAGAATIAAGRRVLGCLERSVFGARVRLGSGVGRASAGGAAGTAGTAGALAGKGAAVCVGVLCATGMGTAALVGLPTGIIASRPAGHHRRTVHRSSHDRGASTAMAATITTGASNGQAASSAESDPSSARTGDSAQRSRASAHTVGAPAHPVTPGDLVATSATAAPSKVESQPSAKAASTSATAGASRSEVSVEYPSASSSSASASSSSSSKHGPCVPGSLSC
jgi:hypothetical protein